MIKTQSIEISFHDLNDAFGIQDRIAELFYERIQPAMESLFDELFDKDHIAVIERVEVDCGILSKKNWEEEWIEGTLRKLKDQLRQADKKEKKLADVSHEFFFYLQHARLPWNSRVDSLVMMEKELIADESFIKALRAMIVDHPIAAKRLVNKFSSGFIKKLIHHFLAIQNEKRKIITGPVSELREQKINQELIDEALLITLSSHIEPEEEEKFREIFFTKVFQHIKEQSEPPTGKVYKQNKATKKEKIPESNKPAEKEEAVIYINNAGLVILHPFLPQFFEQLGFTEKGQWKNEQLQHHAALVLEYIATGIEELEEFNLPLPKILCGIHVETVITEAADSTANLKEPCDELIRETIRHWAALKNTGIESFRHTFLQRNGKLSPVDNGWLLQVERQAVDILLSNLPWGIGVIKLPWMNEMIYTEWV